MDFQQGDTAAPLFFHYSLLLCREPRLVRRGSQIPKNKQTTNKRNDQQPLSSSPVSGPDATRGKISIISVTAAEGRDALEPKSSAEKLNVSASKTYLVFRLK